MSTKTRNPYEPGPHPMAETLAKIREHIKSQTPAQIFASAVRAGIYTPDGKLTPFYRGEDNGSTKPETAPEKAEAS